MLKLNNLLKKRIVAVSLAAFTMLSALSACSSKKPVTQSQQATTSESTVQKNSGLLTDKEVALKVLIGEHASFPVKRYEESQFLQYITKVTGVKMDLMPVPDAGDAYKQKLNIMLNSNEIPDIIWTSSNDANINTLALKGAFLAYTDHLQYAPNIKKIFDTNPDVRRSFLAQDGKLYILPRITPNVMSEIFIAREDILAKENIKEPQNYDELYTMLKTLKGKYPDYITFINRNGGEHLVNRLAYSWGSGYEPATFGFYLNRDTNKYQYGPLDANFKDMVAWLKKLFDEKILDEEYALRTTKQWEEAFANAKALFTIDYIDRIKSLNEGYINNKNSARVVAINPPKGPTGKSGIIAKSAAMANSGIVISSKVKDPIIAIKFVDWFFSEKGRYIAAYGIEGETFTIGADGKPSYTAQMKRQANPNGKDLTKDFGWVYYLDKYEFTAGFLKPLDSDPKSEDDRWMHSREKMEKAKGVIPAEPVLSFTDEQTKALKSKSIALSDHFKQNIDKFIMGTRPFGEWNKFMEELNKLGVSDISKIYNDAYSEFIKK